MTGGVAITVFMLRAAHTTAGSRMLPWASGETMGVSRTGERVGEGTANRKAQDVLYTSDEGREVVTGPLILLPLRRGGGLLVRVQYM